MYREMREDIDQCDDEVEEEYLARPMEVKSII